MTCSSAATAATRSRAVAPTTSSTATVRSTSASTSGNTDPAKRGSADLMESQYLRDAQGQLHRADPAGRRGLRGGRRRRPDDRAQAHRPVAAARRGLRRAGARDAEELRRRSLPRPAVRATRSPRPRTATHHVNQTVAPVAPQKVSDGIDTLPNVEQLKFADQTVSVAPAATLSAASASTSQLARVVRRDDAAGTDAVRHGDELRPPAAGVHGRAPVIGGTNASDFTVVGEHVHRDRVEHLLGPARCGSPRRRPATRGRDADAELECGARGGEPVRRGTVPAVNQPATGLPLLADTSPANGQRSSVTSGRSPATGTGCPPCRAFRFQWRRHRCEQPFNNVAAVLGGKPRRSSRSPGSGTA